MTIRAGYCSTCREFVCACQTPRAHTPSVQYRESEAALRERDRYRPFIHCDELEARFLQGDSESIRKSK